jgi:hypothetical protein
MHRPLTPRDHLVLIAVFGGMLAYLGYGALIGDLYIPYKRGDGGFHVHGSTAWVITLGPALLYLAILVRHGLVSSLGPRGRICVELALLLAGVAAFAGGLRIGAQ